MKKSWKEMAKKMLKKLKEEVEKKGFTLSVTENGKDGKSKMIVSCGFLENLLRQFSKEEGVTLADSVETLGVDLTTRVKTLGGKRKSLEEEEVQVRFSIIKKNEAFRKNYMKECVKKLLRAAMMPAWTWGAHAVEMSTERFKLRRQMAAAAGKKSPTSLSLFMETYGQKVEEELSTMATQYWAEGVWTRNGVMSKKNLG